MPAHLLCYHNAIPTGFSNYENRFNAVLRDIDLQNLKDFVNVKPQLQQMSPIFHF